MKLLKLIVQKLVEATLCLALMWGFWHFTRWLWPAGLWVSVAFFAILAVDMALIVSGIAPHGLLDRRKFWSKK